MTKQEFAENLMKMEKSLYYTAKSILKNDFDCADAVQEAALTAYSKLSSLKHPEYFKTWMTRILINECYRMLRSKRYHSGLEEAREMSEVENSSEMTELIVEIDSLNPGLRLPFVMYYSVGYTTKEIAKTLRISESAVKTRLFRAREALKSKLKGDYEL